MLESQPVVVPPARAAVFLVATVDPGGEDTVRDLLEDFSGLRRSVAFRAYHQRLEDGLRFLTSDTHRQAA